MPDYLIQQKINTIAHLSEPFEHNSFQFKAHNVDISAGTQGGWIATRMVTAENFAAACGEFFPELFALIDKVSFVSQCFTVVALEPCLVKRTDRTKFYLRHARRTEAVPLHFDDNQIRSLEALEQYEQKGDEFRYLREAINAPDFYARLAMLVSALEAIAGELGAGRTNREEIKNSILMDDEINDRIFGSGTGIRNQLLHGKKIDVNLHGDTTYNTIIYDKIVSYFNNNHGTRINAGVVSAPRSPGRNYVHWTGWLNPKVVGIDIDLSR